MLNNQAMNAMDMARLAQAIAAAKYARSHAKGPVAPDRPTLTKTMRTDWVEGATFLHRQPRRNKRTGQMEVHILRVPSKRLRYDMGWVAKRKLENSRVTNFKGEVAR